MAVQLPQNARDLLDGPTFVTVSTIRRDGSPQASVMWAERDGDDVLLSTVAGRAKERNLRRDPRLVVTFFNPDNPFEYFAIEGSAQLSYDGGPGQIQRLSQKYVGQPYTGDEGTDNMRVVVRVSPAKIVGQ
jgi:PPOX class probable F420-dependent enzyme